MSIPSGVLRYAGIWNVTSTYTPGMFVQSSLVNNSFAVLQTVTGGADPSVALAPNWVEFPLPPSGDITSVTAGTGLTGGGSAGNVTLDNAGVLDITAGAGLTISGTVANYTLSNAGVLDITAGAGLTRSGTVANYTLSNAGVLDITAGAGLTISGTVANYTIAKAPPFQATYYKTSNQNLSNPNTDITFDALAAWNNDGGYITHTGGSAAFTVVTAGLYQLEWNASVTANGATWSVANNKVISIDITRSPNPEQIVLSQTAVCATTSNYTQNLCSTFYLLTGDVLNCRIQGNFATNTPFATALSNTFDLNTWFSWRYIS